LEQGTRPEFAPEAFTDHYRLGLYHGMTAAAERTFEALRQRLSRLPAEAHAEAKRVLEREKEITQRFRQLRDRRIHATRIRHHGDLDLGQVLYTGKDFVFMDFEGEPRRPLSERRIKRSPLRDVAGMLRSLHYAAYAVFFGQVPGFVYRDEAARELEPWARQWHQWVSAVYLDGYLTTAGKASFIPRSEEELRLLLEVYTLEKALGNVLMEMQDRPDWTRIPLRGVLEMVG
jgi:maltose alpha-D-glucosyltransferase / alpha-amylase